MNFFFFEIPLYTHILSDKKGPPKINDGWYFFHPCFINECNYFKQMRSLTV